MKGCVTLWRQSCLTPPPSPNLLASWEIADRHPNQTICPTRDSCHVLTEIAGQPGTDFSHRGEGVHCTQYTIHWLYKHLAGSFWVLRQNLQQVAPNQEKPHTTPLHSLIYSIYISVIHTASYLEIIFNFMKVFRCQALNSGVCCCTFWKVNGTVLLVLFCFFSQLIDISLQFSIKTLHWFRIILFW